MTKEASTAASLDGIAMTPRIERLRARMLSTKRTMSVEQARIISDPAERARLYRNFQVRFFNEMPALPLFHSMYTYAVDAEIQGVRMGPLFDTSDRFATVRSWYLFAETNANGGNAETPVP